jgi:hypothetical protein
VKNFVANLGCFLLTLATSVANAGVCNVKSKVESLMAAYSLQKADEVMKHYSPTAEVYDGAFGSTASGKDNIAKDVVAAFISMIPDMKWKTAEGTKTTISKNMVFVEWELSGTPSKELKKVPTDLQGPFSARGFSAIEVDTKSCLIKSQRDFYNAPKFFAFL